MFSCRNKKNISANTTLPRATSDQEMHSLFSFFIVHTDIGKYFINPKNSLNIFKEKFSLTVTVSVLIENHHQMMMVLYEN